MVGKILKGLARSLRKNQTDAEKKLWRHLRSRQFQNVKFRRQRPVGRYIVDFCSMEEKLIIELDGGHHTQTAQKDVERTQFLENEGFRVIRVWDNEIYSNVEGVLEYIRQNLRKPPSPRPSPLRRGRKPIK